MGPLLDRLGQLVDKALDPRNRPPRERLGAAVAFVALLGLLVAVVR
jgi:hypothetical protein